MSAQPGFIPRLVQCIGNPPPQLDPSLNSQPSAIQQSASIFLKNIILKRYRLSSPEASPLDPSITLIPLDDADKIFLKDNILGLLVVVHQNRAAVRQLRRVLSEMLHKDWPANWEAFAGTVGRMIMGEEGKERRREETEMGCFALVEMFKIYK
jgi:hypothetical protein